MKNATLDQIKRGAVATLTAKYGYCGLADGDNVAMLNSGSQGDEVSIVIKDVAALNAAKRSIEVIKPA